MHPNKYARRPLLWGLTLAAGLVGSAALGQQPMPGQPMQPDAAKAVDVQIDPKTGTVIVPIGGIGRFDPGVNAPIVDVLVSREGVVLARPDPANPRFLLLTGLA